MVDLHRSAVAALATAALLVTVTAKADPVADFYKDRTITFHVGAGAGGTYGLYSQVLAKHIADHVPGKPTIILKYTGGSSGGMVAANYLHNAAPKDGSALGMTQQTIPVNQVIRPKSSKYDVRKWNWIGGMSPVRNMVGVWHKAPAQTIEDAKKVQVILGATGKSSPTFITPTLMNTFLGTKFKMIRGYKGVKGLDLAMERGETFGRGASWVSVKVGHPDWVREKKFKVLAFDSITKSPDLPDVPRLMDLVKDPKQKGILELIGISAEFGRSVFMPPGTPAARVAAWRKAFADTMKDPAFLADAKKKKVGLEPQTPAELEAMVKRIFSAPAGVVAAARKAMGAS